MPCYVLFQVYFVRNRSKRQEHIVRKCMEFISVSETPSPQIGMEKSEKSVMNFQLKEVWILTSDSKPFF